jgi:hypothetical protein
VSAFAFLPGRVRRPPAADQALPWFTDEDLAQLRTFDLGQQPGRARATQAPAGEQPWFTGLDTQRPMEQPAQIPGRRLPMPRPDPDKPWPDLAPTFLELAATYPRLVRPGPEPTRPELAGVWQNFVQPPMIVDMTNVPARWPAIPAARGAVGDVSWNPPANLESFGWFVEAIRIPRRAGDLGSGQQGTFAGGSGESGGAGGGGQAGGTFVQPLGVIVVSGPFVVWAGDIYCAFAVAGDVQGD